MNSIYPELRKRCTEKTSSTAATTINNSAGTLFTDTKANRFSRSAYSITKQNTL